MLFSGHLRLRNSKLAESLVLVVVELLNQLDVLVVLLVRLCQRKLFPQQLIALSLLVIGRSVVVLFEVGLDLLKILIIHLHYGNNFSSRG